MPGKSSISKVPKSSRTKLQSENSTTGKPSVQFSPSVIDNSKPLNKDNGANSQQPGKKSGRFSHLGLFSNKRSSESSTNKVTGKDADKQAIQSKASTSGAARTSQSAPASPSENRFSKPLKASPSNTSGGSTGSGNLPYDERASRLLSQSENANPGGGKKTKDSILKPSISSMKTAEGSKSSVSQSVDEQPTQFLPASSNILGAAPAQSENSAWYSSYGLLHQHSLPPHCHEPFIYYGYRQNPSSVSYCLQSLFLPSNETMNVWTHFIPLVFMIFHFQHFFDNYLTKVDGIIIYPFYFFSAGVIFTFLGSTLAHTFNCLSLGAREVCFCCDYSTIAFQAIGLTSAFYSYLCPFSCVALSPSFSLMMFFLLMLGNVLCVVCSCKTRYPDVTNRNYLRVGPYVLLFTVLAIPCIYKYYIMTPPKHCLSFSKATSNFQMQCGYAVSGGSRSLFFYVCFFLLLGAFTLAHRFPERWFPGVFDFIGHSHQIFHVCTAIALYCETLLIEHILLKFLDLYKSRRICPADLSITNTTAFYVPMICLMLSFAASFFFAYDLHKIRKSNVD